MRNRALRVLVADDHETVRMGLCAILKSCSDIEVCAEAKNGEEAVEKARELRPDLIILDITMPVLGGIEAAHHSEFSFPTFQFCFSRCTTLPKSLP
jgi:YesN/AraC family two-component response regulator